MISNGKLIKDIVEIDVQFGKGVEIKAKVLGVGVEVGGARYFENMLTDTPKETLEFNLNAQVTNQLFIGLATKGSIDPATGFQIPNSQTYFLGAKVGSYQIGWGDLPNSNDFIFETNFGGFTPFGGVNLIVDINLSEGVRRVTGE